MKRVLLLVLCLTQLCISAQPTLTGANTNPQVGETFSLQAIAYESEGSAGANVTWDFSDIVPSGTTYNFDFVVPSSTPYVSHFPEATVAYEFSGSYDYYLADANTFTRLGAQTSTLLDYANPQDHLRYPFTYNSTYVDTFSGTFVSGGVTYDRSGTFTSEADGYGTLILPDDTLTDVLRIKSIEEYTDLYTISGIPGSITYMLEASRWFKPGIHYSVLSFTHFESSISGPQLSGAYLNPTTVGMQETQAKNFSMSVSPNPASSNATVYIEVKQREQVEVTVLNALGQQVATLENGMLSPGTYNYSMDVQDFPRGVYFVKMVGGGAVLNKKFLVQQ